MRHIPKTAPDPALLVGTDTSDDGGVYKLTDDIALVQSVDYFTPIVDDPYEFGQIAAANALSDIYAMGGTPKTVLNIVGFPIKKLPDHVLAGIMKGAADKVRESGATIVGGHSIDDDEPKFGLAATGIVHPEKFWANKGAKPGDVLVLTKPLGVGIMTTGIKRQAVTKEQEAAVTKVMASLNKEAAEALHAYEPRAVTDVTGFGLLGHSYEMASASEVTFRFHSNDIPLLEGTYELAEKGIIPGGSKSNESYLLDHIHRADNVSAVTQQILCDSITSGGLLAALSPEQAESYVKDLHAAGIMEAAIIGEVEEKSDYYLEID